MMSITSDGGWLTQIRRCRNLASAKNLDIDVMREEIENICKVILNESTGVFVRFMHCFSNCRLQ